MIFRSEYEKILSDCDCQLKDLISGLSRPFRHLETYPSMLNELERGMHEAHPDRGDTQRAAAVFRDISVCRFLLFSDSSGFIKLSISKMRLYCII